MLYGTLDSKAPEVECQDCGRDDNKPQSALDAVALKEAVRHLPASHAHLRYGTLCLRLPRPRCCHRGTSPSWRLAVGGVVTLVMLLLYALLTVTKFSLVPRPVAALM